MAVDSTAERTGILLSFHRFSTSAALGFNRVIPLDIALFAICSTVARG
jgi:hypothetical protein